LRLAARPLCKSKGRRHERERESDASQRLGHFVVRLRPTTTMQGYRTRGRPGKGDMTTRAAGHAREHGAIRFLPVRKKVLFRPLSGYVSCLATVTAGVDTRLET